METATETPSELIVHVGLAKTGSTAIQLYMYRAREALAAQGVHWAETYGTDTYLLNDCAHHTYSHRWGGWLDPAKFKVSPDVAWQSLRETIKTEGGRHIVSSERFGDLLGVAAGEHMLKFVKEIAGSARVRLIAYVRRQDEFIESHFRELIKGGRLSTLEDYLKRDLSFFYYDRMFAQAADILGKDNVIVRVYGRDHFVGGDAVSDFLHALDIAPPVPRESDASDIVNPSLNTLTSQLLSEPGIVAEFTGRPLRARVVRDFFNREKYSNFNQYVLVDDDARRSIMERFKPGNDRLAQTFLSDADACGLEYRASSKTTIRDDDIVLTYAELVALILALQPPPPPPKPAVATLQASQPS